MTLCDLHGRHEFDMLERMAEVHELLRLDDRNPVLPDDEVCSFHRYVWQSRLRLCSTSAPAI